MDIVVGTDGSVTARRAVKVAAHIARHYASTLHIVHGYERSYSDQWREVSEAILADAHEGLDDLDVKLHGIAGMPHEAILEVAREHGADLIVVGNRRGSVADHVLADAPCHVLVAKTT